MVDINMSLGKLILKKNKAVSPVIATILLIALTVTAAAIVYFVVVPILTTKPELVPISYGKVAGTTDRYEIEFSNNGGAAANIESLIAITLTNTTEGLSLNPTAVYVGAVLQIWPYTLNQGNSVTFILDFDTTLTTGESYTITISYDQGKTMDIPFTY